MDEATALDLVTEARHSLERAARVLDGNPPKTSDERLELLKEFTRTVGALARGRDLATFRSKQEIPTPAPL